MCICDVYGQKSKLGRFINLMSPHPQGAFYLFPRSPIPDDAAFVQMLLKKNILVVPGSAFGSPGYFRIAYCVDDATIINSLAGFAEAIKECR